MSEKSRPTARFKSEVLYSTAPLSTKPSAFNDGERVFVTPKDTPIFTTGMEAVDRSDRLKWVRWIRDGCVADLMKDGERIPGGTSWPRTGVEFISGEDGQFRTAHARWMAFRKHREPFHKYLEREGFGAPGQTGGVFVYQYRPVHGRAPLPARDVSWITFSKALTDHEICRSSLSRGMNEGRIARKPGKKGCRNITLVLEDDVRREAKRIEPKSELIRLKRAPRAPRTPPEEGIITLAKKITRRK